MKTTPSRIALYFFLAGAAGGLVAFGCGGGQNNSSVGNPSPTTGSNPAPTATPATGSTAPAPGGAVSTEVSLKVGDAVFQARCVICHGATGLGDGTAGQALNPRPRNFHERAYMDTLTDARIESTIWNGKAGTAMPPWKGLVSESERKSLVLKVRSFIKS